jgi:lysophospholipase L1-like esterase
MTRHNHTYLALGDSYTIGETLPLYDSFPYQVVQMLRSNGFHMQAAEIVAKSGWTTFELAEKLLHTSFSATYDFATLLIGVNNQYRQLPVEDYKTDFEFLLKKALHFTADKPSHVLVLSIPDWGKTLFAANKHPIKISGEIRQFNEVNKKLAEQYKVQYIDINIKHSTSVLEASLLAEDGLHYSAIEHERWAALIVERLQQLM